MARLHFKQAVHINGKDFKPGVHEFSNKDLEHPEYLFFKKHGLITDANATPASPLSIQEQNQRIADGLAKVQAGPAALLENNKTPTAPAENDGTPSQSMTDLQNEIGEEGGDDSGGIPSEFKPDAEEALVGKSHNKSKKKP